MKKLLKKIPFIKYYLLGKEYHKNPPTIRMKDNSNLKGFNVLNTKVIVEGVGVEISDCIFKNTFPSEIQKVNFKK